MTCQIFLAVLVTFGRFSNYFVVDICKHNIVGCLSVSLSCSFGFFLQVLDPEFRKPFTHTNRWFTTMINQPNVKAVIGSDYKLCTKMAQFDGKEKLAG